MTMSIDFPNLGIHLENVGKTISVFGFEIAYYGMIIGLAVVAGIVMASHLAKKSGQDPDIYYDLAIYAVVFSVIDTWAKKGLGIETKIRYVIKSAYTNEILFDRSCDLYLDLSVDSGADGLLGALVDLAASAINTAATDHITAARKANYFILRDIPRGKYSPEYMLDKETIAETKDIVANVK